ncbi:MAG: signal peptide peptidase SppA [Bacteroidaceae bacterium]|nr:signal peptide peptidase SppA [Bacteroidaceae bacterium]
MKDFMKYTLATVVGLLLFSIIATIISIVSIAGMVASEGVATTVEKNSILRIPLRGSLVERSEDGSLPFDPTTILMGGETENISLEEALTALEKAAENKNVVGIYLEAGAFGGTPAMVEELHDALVKFKKESGKWIMAYGDTYSKSAYYLSSVADTIMLNPQGGVDWSGMASQLYFLKDMLEKVGVKMQVFKVGTYKSAVEPFICSEMSEANREQVTSFLTGIWNNMQKDVAESRGISQETLNAIADSQTPLAEAQATIDNKLVDKLCYISEVKAMLKEKTGVGEDDDLHFTTLKDVAGTETVKKKIKEEVAVYYAYGDIVDEAGNGMSQGHQITGKGMTDDLQKLREDDNVKAVVIRVNSGGGSAYASEQIWHEVMLLKEKKPVVVSMGGMAASGGYYISCAANKIIAEPTTLTGSIGIFGMFPDPSELITQKIGVKFDGVKTNALSDFGAMGRPFNETESALLQSYIEKGYDLFTGRVADGRGMAQDSVKAIAEGRVWTGEQALSIGLVDQLGNLEDAIKVAAAEADIEKYSIGRYPAPEPWFANIMNKKKNGYLDSQMRQMLGEYYTTFSLLRTLDKQNPIQARMPFYMTIQ